MVQDVGLCDDGREIGGVTMERYDSGRVTVKREYPEPVD